MLTRPLIAFDIETVPDPDFGRRVMGFEGDNAAVINAMTSRRLEETEGRTQYPTPPLHRIVTIAAARLDLDGDSFEVDTLGGDAWDEKSHLEGFARLLHDTSPAPRLISWNGNGFDLPVIRYRAMLHGVPLPALYRTDGEWKWNNYQSRFHDMHVDLMDVLSGFGASRFVGLGQMSEMLGLPGKGFIEDFERIQAQWKDFVVSPKESTDGIVTKIDETDNGYEITIESSKSELRKGDSVKVSLK